MRSLSCIWPLCVPCMAGVPSLSLVYFPLAHTGMLLHNEGACLSLKTHGMLHTASSADVAANGHQPPLPTAAPFHVVPVRRVLDALPPVSWVQDAGWIEARFKADLEASPSTAGCCPVSVLLNGKRDGSRCCAGKRQAGRLKPLRPVGGATWATAARRIESVRLTIRAGQVCELGDFSTAESSLSLSYAFKGRYQTSSSWLLRTQGAPSERRLLRAQPPPACHPAVRRTQGSRVAPPVLVYVAGV